MESGSPRRPDPRRSTRHTVSVRRRGQSAGLADRFTQVFLLEIDEPTMLARLDARQDNEWGRAGDSREYICRRLPEYQNRLRVFEAIPIDATPPLDQVADAILSRTPTSSATSRAGMPGPGERPVTRRARRCPTSGHANGVSQDIGISGPAVSAGVEGAFGYHRCRYGEAQSGGGGPGLRGVAGLGVPAGPPPCRQHPPAPGLVPAPVCPPRCKADSSRGLPDAGRCRAGAVEDGREWIG